MSRPLSKAANGEAASVAASAAMRVLLPSAANRRISLWL